MIWNEKIGILFFFFLLVAGPPQMALCGRAGSALHVWAS